MNFWHLEKVGKLRNTKEILALYTYYKQIISYHIHIEILYHIMLNYIICHILLYYIRLINLILHSKLYCIIFNDIVSYCIIFNDIVPVVPHKAVAEVSE